MRKEIEARPTYRYRPSNHALRCPATAGVSFVPANFLLFFCAVNKHDWTLSRTTQTTPVQATAGPPTAMRVVAVSRRATNQRRRLAADDGWMGYHQLARFFRPLRTHLFVSRIVTLLQFCFCFPETTEQSKTILQHILRTSCLRGHRSTAVNVNECAATCVFVSD